MAAYSFRVKAREMAESAARHSGFAVLEVLDIQLQIFITMRREPEKYFNDPSDCEQFITATRDEIAVERRKKYNMPG
jgi:hypothetical protein